MPTADELLNQQLQRLVTQLEPEGSYLVVTSLSQWMSTVAVNRWDLNVARHVDGQAGPLMEGEIYELVMPDRDHTKEAKVSLVSQSCASLAAQTGAGFLVEGRQLTLDQLYSIAGFRAMEEIERNGTNLEALSVAQPLPDNVSLAEPQPPQG